MWHVEFDRRAAKELQRLGTADKRRIAQFIDERLLAGDNPRKYGLALSGKLSGLWRYRVGDVRIICRIEDDQLMVLVIKVGKRSEIYR